LFLSLNKAVENVREEQIKCDLRSSDGVSVSALLHTCRMRNSAWLTWIMQKVMKGLSSDAGVQGLSSLTDHYSKIRASQNIDSKLL